MHQHSISAEHGHNDLLLVFLPKLIDAANDQSTDFTEWQVTFYCSRTCLQRQRILTVRSLFCKEVAQKKKKKWKHTHKDKSLIARSFHPQIWSPLSSVTIRTRFTSCLWLTRQDLYSCIFGEQGHRRYVVGIYCVYREGKLAHATHWTFRLLTKNSSRRCQFRKGHLQITVWRAARVKRIGQDTMIFAEKPNYSETYVHTQPEPIAENVPAPAMRPPPTVPPPSVQAQINETHHHHNQIGLAANPNFRGRGRGGSPKPRGFNHGNRPKRPFEQDGARHKRFRPNMEQQQQQR